MTLPLLCIFLIQSTGESQRREISILISIGDVAFHKQVSLYMGLDDTKIGYWEEYLQESFPSFGIRENNPTKLNKSDNNIRECFLSTTVSFLASNVELNVSNTCTMHF